MKTKHRLKQQSDYKLRKRGELKIKVIDYLTTHPCVMCGESDPVVLQFDHIDPSQKICSVSKMINDCRSWEQINNEITKCQVLCANCHLRKTNKQLNFWKQIT